jgi:hypothetical protein
MASHQRGQRFLFSRQGDPQNFVRKIVTFSDEDIIFFSNCSSELALEESTHCSPFPAIFDGLLT